MEESFFEKLSLYYKAAIPVYYILTEDEQSTIYDIEEVCNFYHTSENSKLEAKDYMVYWDVLSDNDPISIMNNLSPNKTLIMFNPHLSGLDQPDFIQTIKNNSNKWSGFRNKLILLCNDNKIPVELNRDILFIDYGLPNEVTLSRALVNIVESIPDGKFKYNKDKYVDEKISSELIQSSMGLTSKQSENAYSLSLIKHSYLEPKEVTRFKANEYLKTGILELEEPKELSSFVGYENLKQYIEEIKDSFNSKSKYGLPPAKGIILVGVPGTGKTLASKAIASVLNLMLLKVDIGKLLSEYVGASDRNLRLMYEIAEKMSPIILRIDEIEKQLAGSGGSGNNDGGVTKRLGGSFLTWLQECSAPIFKIGTANDVTSLRPEMLRAGRFDKVFFFDLPNSFEIKEILKYHLSSRMKDEYEDLDNEEIIDMLNGFSGAEIEQVVIHSLRKYERFSNPKDEHIDIYEILYTEIENTTPLSIFNSEYVNEIRQWAKAANAVNASKVVKEKIITNRRNLG